MACIITCLVDARRESARAALKPTTSGTSGSRRPEIVFGGGVQADRSVRRGDYFVEADTEAAAGAFVLGDPYTTLYDTVAVVAFPQRTPPRPEPADRPRPFDLPGDLPLPRSTRTTPAGTSR